MSGHVIAVVQRELRHGKSGRAIARHLTNIVGVKTSEQTVRRIKAHQYTPGRVVGYRRCSCCGGLVKADRPCLACSLVSSN